MLKGKTVVIGVTGSIAAYKMPELARLLKKSGCDTEVIMTPNAEKFISPLTFESLTGNRCITDTFDRNFRYSVEHVALAKRADAFVVSPASADVIGKIACGIADDMLTTTIMACPCVKIIAPAMNHNMYHNPIVQDNIEKLRGYGYVIIPPERGMLANGDTGDGRMPPVSVIYDHIVKEIAYEKDMKGKKVVVSAGATRESIDPVRYITNHSSGKMGYALAADAAARGAEVVLVSGKTELSPPLCDVRLTVSAADMFGEIKECARDADIIVMAAAVADYRPVSVSSEKIKKKDGNMDIELERTDDILKYLGENKKQGQFICGFSMETENLAENSRKKLYSKNADMICANSLRTEGAGFGTDTNVITIITADSEISTGLVTKAEAAHRIFDEILLRINNK